MTTHHSKVLIIGAGPAGYTAAIYAARANLEPILVTGLQPGGQLTITTDVENYPGFAEAVQGPDLMERMRMQAERVGARIVFDTITAADLSGESIVARGDGGDLYNGATLIIATGAQARWMGIPGEKRFGGHGVSACATCDGFFFRGKEVAVVGGGNTAVEEALYLTNHATRVTLIHRRNRLRAEPILQDRLLRHPKIDVRWNAVVEAVLGWDEPTLAVTGLRLRDVVTGERDELRVSGFFVAIGHDPATGMFKGQLEMLEGGYVKVASWSTATSARGVFAAGDCADGVFRQATVATAMGCMAALEAEKFLAEGSADHSLRAEAQRCEVMIGAYQ